MADEENERLMAEIELETRRAECAIEAFRGLRDDYGHLKKEFDRYRSAPRWLRVWRALTGR